ncbi:hypothetical protein CDL15_Pgr010673 [Punica granatum]|uniref:Uncharacterized protein n=1 Tax=Punica granatum TaxID=22663 RepID=A0A218XPA9_PUNGR|nr:hypothetical protein CDL15_Pgr010673 [Punica granatum]
MWRQKGMKQRYVHVRSQGQWAAEGGRCGGAKRVARLPLDERTGQWPLRGRSMIRAGERMVASVGVGGKQT